MKKVNSLKKEMTSMANPSSTEGEMADKKEDEDTDTDSKLKDELERERAETQRLKKRVSELEQELQQKRAVVVAEEGEDELVRVKARLEQASRLQELREKLEAAEAENKKLKEQLLLLQQQPLPRSDSSPMEEQSQQLTPPATTQRRRSTEGNFTFHELLNVVKKDQSGSTRGTSVNNSGAAKDNELLLAQLRSFTKENEELKAKVAKYKEEESKWMLALHKVALESLKKTHTQEYVELQRLRNENELLKLAAAGKLG